MFLLGVLSLTACGTQTAKPEKDWIEVRCSGFSEWEVCNAKAAKICPEGYEIYDKVDDMITRKRAMMISCKK